jgi:hypothetical protein
MKATAKPVEEVTAAPEEEIEWVKEEPEPEVEEESADDPTAEDEDEDGLENEGRVPLESLPPDEPLFEGGPLVGQVLEWKKEHGEVWVTTLNPYTNNHVVWRPLNRHEYRGLVGALEQAMANGVSNAVATMDNEEAVCETVVLFPKYNRHDRKGTLAGMPQTISQEVMEMSGFAAVEVIQL